MLEHKRWKQQGITVAGGYGLGNQSNQLNWPLGIAIDDDKTVYVTDYANHRIVEWKFNSKNGKIIADQLSLPTDIIIDKKNNSCIICDGGNRRVIRLFHQNKTNQQILISNISCYGLTMDKNGFMYISDAVKSEVRRWKEGDKDGKLVAGGNGKGNHLNQLNGPSFISVDENYSIYVVDSGNDRVMKWKKGGTEGIIVAGGNGGGNSLKQLIYPWGIIVDRFGQIYVADQQNNRVVRWREGDAEGSIIVGGNGKGNESNQLNYPSALSFDVEENLYVADFFNHRIQKYEVEIN